MRSMLGRIIGNYEIVSQFGEGGMGELYLGRHRTLAREVIVKTIRTEDFSPRQIEHLRTRLEREAFVQSQLDHPNIVRVYDFIIAEDTACMVMEFVPGRDLRRMIARETGAIMPARAIKLFKQVLRAVDYAHHFIYLDKNGAKHQGIIHRDLKPANILVTPQDIAKVTDFGIVKLRGVRGGTQMGFNPGTPEYMSPEQIKGRDLDHRSDLYALGIVFYEMLTGQVPFTDTGEDTSDHEIRRGHIEIAPPPPRQYKPDLSPELEKIVLKSLEKDPDERYQTARDFYLVLEEFERSGKADFSQVATPPRSTVAGEDARGTGLAVADSATTLGFHEDGTASQPNGTTAIRDNYNGKLNSNGLGEYKPLRSSDGIGNYQRSPLPKVDDPPKAKWLGLMVATLSFLVVFVSWWVLSNRNGTLTSSLGGVNPPPTPINDPANGMRSVPGGTFKMGRDDGNEYESPAHVATVKPFLLDTYEVTNEQYEQFVKEKRWPTPNHWNQGTYPIGEAKLPVTNVNWTDAKTFCEWAGKRLPAEEEWEFAARGLDGRLYPYGNEWKPLYSNAVETGLKKPQGVGNYPEGQSPFKIFDLAGNVAEWTATEFTPYPNSKAKPDPGNYIIKGGGFKSLAKEQRATERFFDRPTAISEQYGFRCAKDSQ